MKELTLLVVAIVATIFGAVWGGFVLSILWGWFVAVPFGVIVLTVPMAIGLHLTVSFMTQSITTQQAGQTYTDFVAGQLSEIFFRPLVSLAIGWVVTFFM